MQIINETQFAVVMFLLPSQEIRVAFGANKSEVWAFLVPNVVKVFFDPSVQFSVSAVKNAGNRLDEAFFSVLSVLIEVKTLFTVVALAYN